MENISGPRRQILLISAVLSLLLAVSPAISDTSVAGMLIYPSKGQSPEQQKRDEYECHQWAVQQTGFDPTQATQSSQHQSATRRGGVVRGALGGALLGAGIGAIAGDAGKGAAIGAIAGGAGGGIRQRRMNRQADEANRQAMSNRQAALNEYNRAKAVCLEGRGYKVSY
jgi:hypothetical protein